MPNYYKIIPLCGKIPLEVKTYQKGQIMYISKDINLDNLDEVLEAEILNDALNRLYENIVVKTEVNRFVCIDEPETDDDKQRNEHEFKTHLRAHCISSGHLPENMSFADFFDIYRERLYNDFFIDCPKED